MLPEFYPLLELQSRLKLQYGLRRPYLYSCEASLDQSGFLKRHL